MRATTTTLGLLCVCCLAAAQQHAVDSHGLADHEPADSLRNALQAFSQASSPIYAEYDVVGAVAGTIAIGFDPQSRAWFKFNNDRVWAYSPGGQSLAGFVHQPLARWPEGDAEQVYHVIGDFIPQLPVLAALERPDSIAKLERRSDGTFLLRAYFVDGPVSPRDAANLPGSPQAEWQEFVIDADGRVVTRLRQSFPEPTTYSYSPASPAGIWIVDKLPHTSFTIRSLRVADDALDGLVQAETLRERLKQVAPPRSASEAAASDPPSQRRRAAPAGSNAESRFSPVLLTGLVLFLIGVVAWILRRR